MTIHKLLQHLASRPPEARVVVVGYEGIYNDITIRLSAEYLDKKKGGGYA